MTTKSKPTHGRLIFIENKGSKQQVIETGTFALLNFRKQKLKADPRFRGGRLKVTY
jgi:hypothetical protein